MAITTKTEIELREISDTEDEEPDSGRKQKVKVHEPINKGKILGGKRENFEIEGLKQESRVKKKDGAKKEEEKKINYQMMKIEK